MDNYQQLIKSLKQDGYLRTSAVIDAFLKIRREDFLPAELKNQAALNRALPIGEGQTNSQPLTVAFMLELLQPRTGQRILDVGSGSGWTTTLLAEIVGEGGKVFALERIEKIKQFGEQNVAKYGFLAEGRVVVLNQDGYLGLPEEVPFDRILGSAALPEIPRAWKEQLRIGGAIVAPVDDTIYKLTKTGENKFKEEKFPGFVFVPMIKEKH